MPISFDDHALPDSPAGWVYGLRECFSRSIPVVTVEFNPPPVNDEAKKMASYWVAGNDDDSRVLRMLRSKLRHIGRNLSDHNFVSVTDSAAGTHRIHNLDMVDLLSDPEFTQRHLSLKPIRWEPQRTLLHLTRNHSVAWIESYLNRCRALGFENLLLITGDPLKGARLPSRSFEQVISTSRAEWSGIRLKNSVELLKFVRRLAPDLFVGAAHNPFISSAAVMRHLQRKIDAGAQFLVTQPVAYYDSCWFHMERFESYRQTHFPHVPMICGVFNYFVPCTSIGFREEDFEKRYRFWKRLFSFVPDEVRRDYERGLNGIEIMARSIQKLKRLGFYHFDVMNAEKAGGTVVMNSRRFHHETDRISGGFLDPDSS